MHARSMSKVLRKVLKNVVRVEQKAGFYGVAQKEIEYPQHVRIADYRSDTLSKPNLDMRKMMFEANVGDDVYGEDPTVRELEAKGAAMLGKDTSLFVPSGTMANLLALMSHSTNRGCEVIVGDESHIIVWEQAGAAQVAGVQLRTAVNRPDGTFDIDEMLSKVRDTSNILFPKTTLVCVENTHNTCGGRVLPLSWLRDLADAAREKGLPIHMDGARFFNAVVTSGIPPHEIARDCDTINICLSKGLGCPLGSLLIGSEKTISKARLLRKVLGGGMRQVGVVAAAGIYALDHMVPRLREDHKQTYNIAKAIHEIGSKIISVDLDTVETNILLIKLDPQVLSSQTFCKRMALVTDEELKEDVAASVKMFPWNPTTARLVVCCNNDAEDERVTINKLKRVIAEYENGIFIT